MVFKRLSGYKTDLKQILHQIRHIAKLIQQSFEMSEMLNIIVSEVSQILSSDRSVIYRLLDDGNGAVVAESVNVPWKPILGQLIYEPCFNAKQVKRYKGEWVDVVQDINTKPLDIFYKQLLISLQVRAYLVVPILVSHQEFNPLASSSPHLWGLLIAHQCSSPRQWNCVEIEFMQLVAVELGIVLQRSEKCPEYSQNGLLNQHRKNQQVATRSKFRLKNIHLDKKRRDLVKEASLQYISDADLHIFDRLQTPIWIYDLQKFQMWWANIAALRMWNVPNREDLLNCNFSYIAESIKMRSPNYGDEFRQGKTITENWIFYQEGTPISIRCLCSGIKIAPRRILMLVEGTREIMTQIEEELCQRETRCLSVITAHQRVEETLQKQAERERMVYMITQHIRQSLDLDEILNTAVVEVQNFLQTDRVIIYRFNPNGSSVVVTESVKAGLQPILHREITHNYFHCFVETQGDSYRQGMVSLIPDIYTAGFTDAHLDFLVNLQVKSKIIVPIIYGDYLWGLLVAHNCSDLRVWQSWESELLKQLAMQLAIAIQQSELYQKLQLANQQLQNMAMVDQLTQIANRRCFDSKFETVWRYLLREQSCLSLLICDIDFFKQYNDTYGHTTGDICLTLVAQAITEVVNRSMDLAARYGGEEFVVILPHTNSYGATQVAQKIHAAIQRLNIPHIASKVEPYVTVSIGIATVIPVSDLTPVALIEAADKALYQAKAQGRNRYSIHQLKPAHR